MDAHHKTLRGAAVAAAALLCLPAAVQKAPARIISVVPAVTEMLFAIGAGPQMVGVGSYDKFPPETAALPKVGALIDPDFEKILSLRPDLVVAYGTQADFIARLQKAGIAIFPFEDGGIPDITATMRRLGNRIGRAAEADAAATKIERDLDAVRQRVAPFPKTRTLLIFGREPGSLRGIYASAGEGFLHDLLVLAGGIDVFGELKQKNIQITTEQILARAPDAIVEFYGSDAGPAKLAAERQVWSSLQGVPAVRNNRIFLLAGDLLTVPGPRIAEAARMLAEALHPR